MKITLAQLNYHIGNFEGNLQKMIAAIEQAKAEFADIICFGELATCGYPPRDFLEFRDFINQSESSIEQLTALSTDIAIVVGSPTVNPVIEGKDLHNSVYFLYAGKVQALVHKALLPTYDIFDEYRYFEPGNEFKVIPFKGKKIALTVCEDIWNVGNNNPMYPICPLDQMRDQAPDFILNASASPFNYGQAQERIHVVKSNVERYGIPMFYVNHVGAQTELIFDGGSLVVNAKGIVVDEMPYFEEAIRTYELESIESATVGTEQPKVPIDLIHRALVIGIRDYFGKLGLKQAILGLSGGIDSALTAVLAVQALGKENVRGLLMPSEFSTGHSVSDAKQLAENLGIQYDIQPIKPVYDAYETMLQPYFEGLAFDVTEENIQARIRGMLLMAFANKFGYILLNTTNKSEMAVGYGTLYGDMCGGISVLGDVYKTQVYELSHHINKDAEIIPINSINKAPSAELRPGQKDSDSLPEYDILDKILYQYIEKRKGPQEIIDMGLGEAIIRRTLKMVNVNEFKRHQTAPVLRVSPKAFGQGRRVPIVGKYLS
ncbi:MAG: NAD+ synthase [Saprospiraceae bacterium]